MQANRSRDTKPELAVRRLLHGAGMRYRVDISPEQTLRRRADIVFPKQRLAIFIDGCFWHGCPAHGRREWQHNPEYWPDKIERNRARDNDTTQRLEEAGWTVLRYWEHQPATEVAADIEAQVRTRRPH
jgi:DNA mismatch endonuclease (patch repair protein)